ncbi:MAG TPA: trehalose-phosphatase [Actinomycetaceae bacterium]|nr:trehalose-phosphatase [Actinomycetaceae bacterium]
MSDPVDHTPAFFDHLEEGLDRALRELSEHSPLLVALDFDGVLAPLVDDPADSRIAPATAAALTDVAVLDGVELAIVTGRQATDLLRIAEIPAGTRVVASHGAQNGRARATAEGLQWDGGPVALTDAESKLRARLAADAAALVAEVPGAWLEEKPASVVVHTRQASEDDETVLTDRVLRGPAQLDGVRHQHGKRVIELSVLTRTKGDGIAELRADTRASAVLFVGDDVTDEDGFAVLEPQDVGIKVGPGHSIAGYRIDTPEQVTAVLRRLIDLRTEGS